MAIILGASILYIKKVAQVKIYAVKEGDIPWKIEQENQDYVKQIRKWNRLNDNSTRSGQPILIKDSNYN